MKANESKIDPSTTDEATRFNNCLPFSCYVQSCAYKTKNVFWVFNWGHLLPFLEQTKQTVFVGTQLLKGGHFSYVAWTKEEEEVCITSFVLLHYAVTKIGGSSIVAKSNTKEKYKDDPCV